MANLDLLYKNISFVFLWLGLWEIISTIINHFFGKSKRMRSLGFFIVFILGIIFTLYTHEDEE
jgi:hypothetical protein